MFYLFVILLATATIVKTESTESTETIKPSTESNESTTKPTNITRIVGGYPVPITKFPWQVSLIYNGDFSCGGSVISRYWVLTAAHCTIGNDPKLYRVRGGSDKWRSGGQLKSVILIVINAAYVVSTFNYDISMMKVDSPWKYSASLQPVKLSLDAIPPTKRGYVSGFGARNEGGGATEKLRAVDVDYFTRARCQQLYQGVEVITPQMTCAGARQGGRDSCQGDSGGALVYNNVQYGIVSHGQGCARQGFPGVYSLVSSMVRFIVRVLKKYRYYK